MKEHPIIFNTEMTQAILNDHKTQTRRVMKSQPGEDGSFKYKKGKQVFFGNPKSMAYLCPLYKVGDRLWVRETFAQSPDGIMYKASEEDYGMMEPDDCMIWKPSIHMPKWAARIWLEVVDVRVERLQDISEEDAKAEGVLKFSDYHLGPSQRIAEDDEKRDRTQGSHPYTIAFASLWDSINFNRGFGWINNQWLWVITFKRVKNGLHN